MTTHSPPTLRWLAAAALAVAAHPSPAQDWDLVKPSNTGMPGEEVRLARWAPDGDLWVGARHPFWGEGGFGRYDQRSDTWDVFANWETPIPSPFVNDLEWDATGAAWIATGAGLVRYADGTWTVWDTSNSPMAFDAVRDLSIAPDGHVWINSSSSSGGGDAIWDFDGVATWRRHAVGTEIPFALPWTDFAHVFVSSDGHVWAANDTLQGVAEYDGNSWTLRGTNLNKFDEMAEDQFGNIWLNGNLIGALDAFHRWDGSSFTTYAFPEPTTLASDPEDGTIYFGNWFGTVLRTSDGGATIEPYLSGLNRVEDIAPDPTGDDVWIATGGALGHFTGTGAWVEDFNSWNTGFPDYFVDGLQTDADGWFWVATGEAGLSRFDGRAWRNWGDHNVGSEPYPFAGNEPMGASFRDSQGRYWFGGNGIARWNETTSQFEGFWNWQNNPGMGVTLFIDFAENAAGEIFASTEYGTIFRYDEGSDLWVNEHHIYSAGGFPGIVSDSAGDVWVAGWFGIERRDGGAWTEVVLPYPDYFFDLGGINDVAIGPDDVFWFGTVEGLVRWDGTAFELFDTSNSRLHAPNVRSVDVRADGLVALAARTGINQDGGLDLIDGNPSVPASWTSYTAPSAPIPHPQVEEVAFDGQGHVWISGASEGVAVLRIGAWDDLGSSLDGTRGAPFLTGVGLPLAGETIRLRVLGALEGSTATLVLGLGELDAPFKGGVLVPEPTLLVSGLPTGDGDFDLPGAWPADVPSGASFVAQAWIADAAGAKGLAATNAVRVTAP